MEKRYSVHIKDKNSEWIEQLSLDILDPLQSAQIIVNDFNKRLSQGGDSRELISVEMKTLEEMKS